MTFLGKRLAVAIPDTVLEEQDSLREKTAKLGTVARACSIYGVDLVQVFRDNKRRGEPALIRKVLEYIETPQYLRRRLFALDESLKYAGLLPPLRIPSHRQKVPFEKLAAGEVREGVTNPDGTVDIGLERNPRLVVKAASNRRMTVRVTSKSPFLAELVDRSQVHEYWGYRVETPDMEEMLADRRFSLRVATSRYGNSLQSQVFQLRNAILKADSVKLLFGSPTRGLFELVGRDLTSRVDFVVNVFGEQHVETVRTEEAVFAALNLVNTLAL